MNYTRGGLRKELDNDFAEGSPNDLSEDEKEYLDGRNHSRNNMRFNDTEWERTCRQADLLNHKHAY